jgi:hypothetical protein
MQPNKAPVFKEKPRYRLTERAFLSGVRVRRGKDWVPYDDVLLDPESMPLATALSGPFDGVGGERQPLEIEFDGIPGEHMEPLNEAAVWATEHAEELKKEARLQRSKRKGAAKLSVIDRLTEIGPDATVLNEAKDSV